MRVTNGCFGGLADRPLRCFSCFALRATECSISLLPALTNRDLRWLRWPHEGEIALNSLVQQC